MTVAPAVSALIACTLALSSAACTYRRTGDYCTFGAETAALAPRCAEINFGASGLLVLARAVNEDVLAQAPGPLLCTEHVARARRKLAAYADYSIRELYSCDAEPVIENGRPVCHVSLLVTSAGGTRVVLDNGHVLEPGTTGGVAEYGEFVVRVDRHWLGEPPDALAVPAP